MGAIGIVSLVLAGFGAMLGGAIGNQSFKTEYENQMQDLDDAAEEAKREKEQAEDKLETEFKAAKAEAERTAGRMDWQSGQNEGFASNDFNNQIDQLFLGQEADTFQYNTAAMNIGASKGNSLSAMAASGTRSGSMQNAVDLESAVNSYALQLQEDQQRAARQSEISGLVNNFQKSKIGIQSDRWSANDLRADYAVGGGKYSIYKNAKEDINEDYEAYLGQINKEKQRMEDNKLMGQIAAIFTGGRAGFSVGKSLAKLTFDTYSFGLE